MIIWHCLPILFGLFPNKELICINLICIIYMRRHVILTQIFITSNGFKVARQALCTLWWQKFANSLNGLLLFHWILGLKFNFLWIMLKIECAQGLKTDHLFYVAQGSKTAFPCGMRALGWYQLLILNAYKLRWAQMKQLDGDVSPPAYLMNFDCSW